MRSMAGFWLFLVVLVLVSEAVHNVVGDEPVKSIDCGLPDSFVSYWDPDTRITYVPDGTSVDGGENHNVTAASDQTGRVPPLESLRSFPPGEQKQNCYALPTDNGTTYLVRAQFVYGNYDGANSPSVDFDLLLGTQPWATVSLNTSVADIATKEAVFLAWAGWVPVCLVYNGGGTPFVSVLELRELGPGNQVYPSVSKYNSLSMFARGMMGTDVALTRRPTDDLDRFWYGMTGPDWVNNSTHRAIAPDPKFKVPPGILQTAVEPAHNATRLTIIINQEEEHRRLPVNKQFVAFLHFADFQQYQVREFDIYVNGNQPDDPETTGGAIMPPYRPRYLEASCVVISNYSEQLDGSHNITLVATNSSKLPPMLNAFEIYALVDMDDGDTTRQ